MIVLDGEDDPPGHKKYVNTRVTIDMLDTEDLIQELMTRNRLYTITARRVVPRSVFERSDFYPAIRSKLAQDLGHSLLSMGVIWEEVDQQKDELAFSATIVSLTPLPEVPS